MEYLSKHICVENYKLDMFPYDLSQLKCLANIYEPDGLIDKLDPEDDFKSGVAIYEAYKNVTPLLASLPDLWVYLAHADLFSYVQHRHKDVLSDDASKEYIYNHWFKNNVSLLRMALPGGWWSVHLSVDYNRKDPYELTKVLYSNQELRTNSFGPLTLIRHREAMIGVLEFLLEHPEMLEDGMNMRAQYIRKLFSFIGVMKRLEYMDRNFFKSELEKRKNVLSRKLTREEILNNNELFNDII
jgi:hypothetical protein